jgi:sigma-B regulation protein RsbQ
MWHHVAPAFAEDHWVVLFDHVGAGNADPAAGDPDRYARSNG